MELETLGDGEFAHLIFDGDSGAASAWRVGRDSVLAEFKRRHPGKRPWAWWRFDAGEYGPRKHGETDIDYLDRHDLLDDGERQRAEDKARIQQERLQRRIARMS